MAKLNQTGILTRIVIEANQARTDAENLLANHKRGQHQSGKFCNLCTALGMVVTQAGVLVSTVDMAQNALVRKQFEEDPAEAVDDAVSPDGVVGLDA